MRGTSAERTEAMVAHLAKEELLKALEGQRQYLPTRLEDGRSQSQNPAEVSSDS